LWQPLTVVVGKRPNTSRVGREGCMVMEERDKLVHSQKASACTVAREEGRWIVDRPVQCWKTLLPRCAMESGRRREVRLLQP